ncbi:MAG: hypothetical protein JRI52_03450, partial [Deltaproteobacteria bacterium]|nr:hypothetical protein [Deltaproteobacteria bacterium]
MFISVRYCIGLSSPLSDSIKMQPRHLKLIVSLFLIMATFAVYGQVRNHDFVNFDDQDYVTENRHVQDGLTLEGLEWAFTTPFGGHWYPLTWLSHMTDFQ